MRVMAVDPGEKRIGIAMSDPTGTIASPLMVIPHESRADSAQKIISLAKDHQAERIIVGITMHPDGTVTFQGRQARRLAGAIRSQTPIPVELWDESGTTRAAREAGLKMGAPQKKRRGHLDEIAAALILQSYLDNQAPGP
jgi:putative Holliday junction resolvase